MTAQRSNPLHSSSPAIFSSSQEAETTLETTDTDQLLLSPFTLQWLQPDVCLSKTSKLSPKLQNFKFISPDPLRMENITCMAYLLFMMLFTTFYGAIYSLWNFYGGLPRASMGRGQGKKQPSALSPLSLCSDRSLKNMTAKWLCYGTAKLHPSVPSPINFVSIWSCLWRK